MYTQLMEQLEGQARQTSHAALSDEYWHMGILTADVRRIAAHAAKAFRMLPQREQDQVVLQLLGHGSDEAAHLGACLCGKTVQDWSMLNARHLTSMVRSFKGWSVTDLFCIEVLQPLLRRFPEALLELLSAWAHEPNQWMRRASVVVFVRKIGSSSEYTEAGLRSCEQLIWDPEDLVRKGVGWALKDLMQGDRAQVLDYVRSLRRRGVSSVITRYALQRVKGPERQGVLAIKPDRTSADR